MLHYSYGGVIRNMLLKDLEFIIPTFQDVVVVEYKKGLRECKSFPVTEWYKINGLNREVISIMPDDWMLYIEVYE